MLLSCFGEALITRVTGCSAAMQYSRLVSALWVDEAFSTIPSVQDFFLHE